jgi:hypothetical protein
VVPDDPSELAEEAARVREELRHEARRRRWLRRFRWLVPTGPAGRPSMRLPALVLSMAIFATLASIFTLGYAGNQRPGPHRSDDAPGAPAPQPRAVAALDLLDGQGRAVALRSQLPAVILLTEGCTCDELVAATAAATPPGVMVVVVARDASALPAAVAGLDHVRPLGDPAGELRSLVGLPASAAQAGVLVVADNADIQLALPAAPSVDSFRSSLERIGHPDQAPASSSAT